ncbi:MAG TPA: PocR ligand-binding domain-containing protein, partial [Pyrinomonadaceae bacterium]|nr:PocR ligand-binding domain-containing protein [Pyrinomonadaceae bacterium]
MEKSAATERAKFQNEELPTLQEWERVQASVAAETDLSILLVEGHQPPQLAISNNNSICHAFQSSPTHAHLCDPYCGVAFQRAHEAGEATFYRCHAGLHCFAMSVGLDAARPLAVIGGRAFLSSADYRELAERFRHGDLRELLSTELFRNVIFSSRHHLDELAAQLAEVAVKASVSRDSTGGATNKSEFKEQAREASGVESRGGEMQRASGVNFPPGLKLLDACQSALEKLRVQFKLKSVALMMRAEEGFMPACVLGKFKNKLPQLTEEGKSGAHLR